RFMPVGGTIHSTKAHRPKKSIEACSGCLSIFPIAEDREMCPVCGLSLNDGFKKWEVIEPLGYITSWRPQSYEFVRRAGTGMSIPKFGFQDIDSQPIANMNAAVLQDT